MCVHGGTTRRAWYKEESFPRIRIANSTKTITKKRRWFYFDRVHDDVGDVPGLKMIMRRMKMSIGFENEEKNIRRELYEEGILYEEMSRRERMNKTKIVLHVC